MQSKIERPKRCHGMLPKSLESSPNMAEGSSSLIIFPVIESAKNFKIQPIMSVSNRLRFKRSDNEMGSARRCFWFGPSFQAFLNAKRCRPSAPQIILNHSGKSIKDNENDAGYEMRLRRIHLRGKGRAIYLPFLQSFQIRGCKPPFVVEFVFSCNLF